ncbi:hypothetical protein ABL78_2504 [Leptomonas seymouri]|uniref:Uncharacterized protein n=1 Tax=Leptomonas seymouri TaxID=5684 RepID=A0A0N1I948_LEPSE|nr:hypothetical protein ABL78_2504 [Leptomonas seymouri]|eukprot:KPI88385.1 hypothetical protein ABL78_2504 [Leptomonas seymouri]
MTSSSSSAAAAASGASTSQDILVKAYKAEVQQLKETLHELALRDTSSGSPDFNAVLESKYLAQIKRNKTLSVQLGTAQQQLADAQRALKVEEEKLKRLVTATTSVAGLSTAAKGGGAAGSNRGRHTNASLNKETGSSDDDGDGEEGGTKNLDSVSAAAQRAYDQLHQREIALAEVQRENAALRSLIQREVGLRDDTSEVDALLKRTTTSSGAAEAGSGGGSGGGKAQCRSSGWRGRAETIVLLKSRLKDAQRTVEALSAAAAEKGQFDEAGLGSVDCGSDGTDPLALPASVRAYLGLEDGSNSEMRSVATTATRRRDVDDDARDRLTTMQQQRAAQQQQQTVHVENLQRQVQEEKWRMAALQARTKTMKTELDTLRGYVETILEKSAMDDELLEAYQLEVRKAQEETREWQKKAAAAADMRHNEKVGPSTTGAQSTTGASQVAGARSVPYRKVAPPPPSDAAPPVSAPPVERNATPPSSTLPKQQEQRQPSVENVDAVVYEWVLRACNESGVVIKSCVAGEGKSDAPPLPSASALAAVLRSALHHVVQVERQAMVASTRDGAGAALGNGKDRPREDATAPQAELVLLKENASLKNRIRTLTDMMEREMQAQKVLWNSRAANAGE